MAKQALVVAQAAAKAEQAEQNADSPPAATASQVQESPVEATAECPAAGASTDQPGTETNPVKVQPTPGLEVESATVTEPAESHLDPYERVDLETRSKNITICYRGAADISQRPSTRRSNG